MGIYCCRCLVNMCGSSNTCIYIYITRAFQVDSWSIQLYLFFPFLYTLLGQNLDDSIGGSKNTYTYVQNTAHTTDYYIFVFKYVCGLSADSMINDLGIWASMEERKISSVAKKDIPEINLYVMVNQLFG